MKPCWVILWDVYGTLVAAQRGDLDSLLQREPELRAAFEQTVRNFGLRISAEQLHREFLRIIATVRAEKMASGVSHPEVRIEEIWRQLLEEALPESPVSGGLAAEAALFFERHANPKSLMPQAYTTLIELQRRGLRQGIISNAQFYTPIELSELLREESAGRVATYESIFDVRLVWFSFALGVAKPDLTAFRAAVDELARSGITPAECLFVGDSLATDITPARQVGFYALRFAPDGDIRQLSQVLGHL